MALRGLSFMGHSKETIASQPEALNECYYYFQKLPNFEISSISLMQRGSLLNVRIEDRITTEQLKLIKQPVMFLWGTRDPFGTVEIGRQIADFIPRGTFQAIQSRGPELGVMSTSPTHSCRTFLRAEAVCTPPFATRPIGA